MDIIEIITKSIQILNTLRTADKELETFFLKKQLSEVYGDLIEVKNHIIDLKDENLKLKRLAEGTDVVSKLRNAFKPEEKSGYLILSEEIDGYKPGKYCNGCFQKNNQAINLIKHDFRLKCPSCGTIFSNPDAQLPKPISVSKPYPNPARRPWF